MALATLEEESELDCESEDDITGDLLAEALKDDENQDQAPPISLLWHVPVSHFSSRKCKKHLDPFLLSRQISEATTFMMLMTASRQSPFSPPIQGAFKPSTAKLTSHRPTFGDSHLLQHG